MNRTEIAKNTVIALSLALLPSLSGCSKKNEEFSKNFQPVLSNNLNDKEQIILSKLEEYLNYLPDVRWDFDENISAMVSFYRDSGRIEQAQKILEYILARVSKEDQKEKNDISLYYLQKRILRELSTVYFEQNKLDEGDDTYRSISKLQEHSNENDPELDYYDDRCLAKHYFENGIFERALPLFLKCSEYESGENQERIKMKYELVSSLSQVIEIGIRTYDNQLVESNLITLLHGADEQTLLLLVDRDWLSSEQWMEKFDKICIEVNNLECSRVIWEKLANYIAENTEPGNSYLNYALVGLHNACSRLGLTKEVRELKDTISTNFVTYINSAHRQMRGFQSTKKIIKEVEDVVKDAKRGGFKELPIKREVVSDLSEFLINQDYKSLAEALEAICKNEHD